MTGKRLLLVAAAGLAFTLAGAQPARADRGFDHDRRECWRKIEKQENKLEKEIRKHGLRSRQAQREREKLQRIRQQCGSRFGWGRNDDRRDRDWRDDDYGRRGGNRNWGRSNHDPHNCRHYDHRHDRDGGFRWGGTFWLRIR